MTCHYRIFINVVRHNYDLVSNAYKMPVSKQYSFLHHRDDRRSIDDAIRKHLHFLNLAADDFLHYILPIVGAPCDETSRLSDFVSLYKDANPGDDSLLIVVNLFRQKTSTEFVWF